MHDVTDLTLKLHRKSGPPPNGPLLELALDCATVGHDVIIKHDSEPEVCRGAPVRISVLLFVQVLKTSGASAKGGFVVLMSDGAENVRPMIREVSPTLQNEMVTVNTIAIGPDADLQMETLSLERGGKAYFVKEDLIEMTGALHFAFFETTTTHLDSSNSPVVVSVPIEKRQC